MTEINAYNTETDQWEIFPVSKAGKLPKHYQPVIYPQEV
jgi:hypothetical protein